MPWERWSAGRIWVGKDGRKTYYGDIGGRAVSLRRHTEEDALAELIRLNVGGSAPSPPLNDQWIAEYLDHCRERNLDRQSINAKERQLREWKERVGPRRMTLPLLAEISKKMSGARNKVACLKAYFTWLRQQGRVLRQHDPTIDLAKPQAKPTDWDRLVPLETHRKLVAALDSRWGDLLTVLMGTGWHVSELLRFCRSGAVEGDVLVCPRHKSGEPHRTRVSEAVLAAATRSRERGGFSVGLFYRDVGQKCDDLGLERIGPGGYRHTVATNAVRAGATPEEVAHFLGHKGSYMVKAIYAKVAVPKKVPTLA
jgi:integrase